MQSVRLSCSIGLLLVLMASLGLSEEPKPPDIADRSLSTIVLNSAAPDLGPVSGNTTVLLSGVMPTGSNNMNCVFTGPPASGVTVTVIGNLIDTSTGTCVTPLIAVAGAYTLQVGPIAGPLGGNSLSFVYYVQPQLVALDPPQGPVGGSNVVNCGLDEALPPHLDHRFARCRITTPLGPEDWIDVVGVIPEADVATVSCQIPNIETTGTGSIAVALNAQQFSEPKPYVLYQQPQVFSAEPAIVPFDSPFSILINGTGFFNAEPYLFVAFVAGEHFFEDIPAIFVNEEQILVPDVSALTSHEFNYTLAVSLNSEQYSTSTIQLLNGIPCEQLTEEDGCERCVLASWCAWCFATSTCGNATVVYEECEVDQIGYGTCEQATPGEPLPVIIGLSVMAGGLAFVCIIWLYCKYRPKSTYNEVP